MTKNILKSFYVVYNSIYLHIKIRENQLLTFIRRWLSILHMPLFTTLLGRGQK